MLYYTEHICDLQETLIVIKNVINDTFRPYKHDSTLCVIVSLGELIIKAMFHDNGSHSPFIVLWDSYLHLSKLILLVTCLFQYSLL